MRFRDPETDLDLLGHHEEHLAHQAATARAKVEAAARHQEATARRSAEVRAEREAVLRQAAEARVAELEALIGGKRS